MALAKTYPTHKPDPTPTPKTTDGPTQYDTSDSEDVRALADAIIATIQTAAFNDMTWAEVDAALRLTSHHIKINWAATSTVQPPPPPEPPAP